MIELEIRRARLERRIEQQLRRLERFAQYMTPEQIAKGQEYAAGLRREADELMKQISAAKVKNGN